ncbi:protein containing DUF82, partial [mine drainage metagenome]
LRMAGYDTAYVQGTSDPEIARWAERDSRRLLTRDRSLAARVPGAIRLTEVVISGQVRELHRHCPELMWELRPLRCTVCNVCLTRIEPAAIDPARLPERIRRSAPPLWTCRACRRIYWVGSHAARFRADIQRWIGEEIR